MTDLCVANNAGARVGFAFGLHVGFELSDASAGARGSVRANPELGPYRYLAIGEQVVLVDPRQQKIVEVID